MAEKSSRNLHSTTAAETKELENVIYDRQQITRCKSCKVPVGRKKAKQCSGRKNS